MYGIVIAMIETLTTQTMEAGENRQIKKSQENVKNNLTNKKSVVQLSNQQTMTANLLQVKTRLQHRNQKQKMEYPQ